MAALEQRTQPVEVPGEPEGERIAVAPARRDVRAGDAGAERGVDVDEVDRPVRDARDQVVRVRPGDDVREITRTPARSGGAGDEIRERIGCRQAAAPTVSGSSRCACEGQYSRLGSGVRWHECPLRVVARQRAFASFARAYSCWMWMRASSSVRSIA